MSDVKDSIDALGENFERLLRWVYPGFLFALLLYLAKPYLFMRITTNPNVGLTGLIIGCIVIGFIVYLLHINFIQQIVVFVIYLIQKKKLSEYLTKEATIIKNKNSEKEKINYINYLWSTCHTMFITVWLMALFLCVKDTRSLFSDFWAVVLGIVILLFLSTCFLFAKLYIAERGQNGKTTIG